MNTNSTKKYLLPYGLICLFALSVSLPNVKAQSRLDRLVKVQNAHPRRVVGYGLVAGLDRTGDRTLSQRGAQFTVQSIANMLKNFGIKVNSNRLRTRNVAAVMVTAVIGPYNASGSDVDVTVSSMGDASSLRGGVLLETPLMDPNTKKVYAEAQGPLVVGGISAELGHSRVSRNASLTATIPGGGTVKANNDFQLDANNPLGLVLNKPGYVNAQRIVDAINNNFDKKIASIYNPGLVHVKWPDAFQDPGARNIFVSTIMKQKVKMTQPARVVINERTGTIVAGGNVSIDNAMVSHGSIQVKTQVTPFISQPPPLSGGKTKVVPVPRVGISEKSAQNMVLKPNTNVQQLAQILDSLGLSPRDVISIFQALDRAGALHGKLIVM